MDALCIWLAVWSAQGDATPDVWRFDTVTNAWSAMPRLPQPRGAGALVLRGRTLHFFGGTGLDRYTSVGDHWTLNLDTDKQWQPAAPLPNPRNHLAAVVIDGAIYAVGGQEGHNETLVTQPSVHRWNPTAPNQWEERAPLPRAVSHIGGATLAIDGRIYVLGGEVSHGKSIADSMVYDPRRNTWTTTTSIPTERHSAVTAYINDTIFYTGGSFQRDTYRGRLTR
jgi:N-acetylneuraminic acid mutarotase